MSKVEIKDFRFGIDRRRPRIAGVPGMLWSLKNAQLSRGGDIEAVKKFAPTFELPANTFGLGQISGQLTVFGSRDLAASMPTGIAYQRLENPDPGGGQMSRVLTVRTFGQAYYVIAEYSDGTIYHWFDGSRIVTWETVIGNDATFYTLAKWLADKMSADTSVEAAAVATSILITASVPGVPFTLSTSTLDGGGTPDQTAVVTVLQPNVSAVAEVRATGTVTVTGGTANPGVNFTQQITVNGVSLLAAPVNFIGSNTATAAALAVAINNNAANHAYTASAAGAIVTIKAAVGSGATPNGYVVAATDAGNVTTSVANMSGGVAEVDPVAQVYRVTFAGTLSGTNKYDQFKITLNGVPYASSVYASAHGTNALVYKKRIYATQNTLFRYTQIDDPVDYTDASPASGAGFINVANDAGGAERLVAAAPYQDQVAIFARDSIRTYSIDTDATANAFGQLLGNTGTVAPQSVLPYGNTDVFYLDETGIRSLQARQATNQPFVNDAGSAIDPLIAADLASLGGDVIGAAAAVIEPTEGRFMLALGQKVYVLSNFPSTKIHAWSTIEPGFQITDWARTKRKLYARSGDTIYLYGGQHGATYPGEDELPIVAELPFVSARDSTAFKHWTAFDLACAGVWQVEYFTDPDDDTKVLDCGKIVNSTFDHPDLASIGEWPMVAPRLTCASGGHATLSSLVLHHEETRSG